MFEVSWLLFIVASLVLIVTPGQDMILVMSRSVAQGPSAGVVTAAGVSVGLIGHTILATLGLGAILRTSEWLFLALKLLGAAYLIYLGIQLLCSRSHDLQAAAGAPRSLLRLFFDGSLGWRCRHVYGSGIRRSHSRFQAGASALARSCQTPSDASCHASLCTLAAG